MKKQIDYADKLDDYDKKLIIIHTSMMHLNTCLRNQKKCTPEDSNLIEYFNQMIKSSPPTDNDMFLYRGIREESNITKEILQYKLPTNEKVFQSCSTSMIIAGTFGQYILKIYLPAGNSFLPVKDFSTFSTENEVLLPYDTKYSYLSEGVENDMKFINVQINIPPKQKEIKLTNADKERIDEIFLPIFATFLIPYNAREKLFSGKVVKFFERIAKTVDTEEIRKKYLSKELMSLTNSETKEVNFSNVLTLKQFVAILINKYKIVNIISLFESVRVIHDEKDISSMKQDLENMIDTENYNIKYNFIDNQIVFYFNREI